MQVQDRREKSSWEVIKEALIIILVTSVISGFVWVRAVDERLIKLETVVAKVSDQGEDIKGIKSQLTDLQIQVGIAIGIQKEKNDE